MDSDIKHPNIFGNYICASILNTEEGKDTGERKLSILDSFLSKDD
jgi:hypothetical protein